MGLLKLDIYHVRNIQQQSIKPSEHINFIFGENASGKSSILEAIYILGRAKSFRSASIKSVINTQQQHLVVAGQLSHQHQIQQLGIQLDGKAIEIHINRQPSQKRADLAYALPLQLIHPKSYELLDAGPQIRRECLDWGVFNHDEHFLQAWRRCKKALSQRNSLLKSKQSQQLNVWDKELAYYGTIVDVSRRQYLSNLKPVFLEIIKKFLDFEYLDISLVSGWDTEIPLLQLLEADLDRDLRYGFTHSGPHRADFLITVNKQLAKDFVSRGQLKLLVLSLKLAQVQLLANKQNAMSCILIDDFAAELDISNRAKLLEFLADLPCQVFITATEMADFGSVELIKNYRLFHVEQGNIKQL